MFAEICDALVIVHGAVGGDDIVEAGAVLGDVHFRIAVMVAQPDQDLGEAAGVDRPAHRGKARARPAPAPNHAPTGFAARRTYSRVRNN